MLWYKGLNVHYSTKLAIECQKYLFVSAHDGLQNWGEGSDSDAGGDEDRVLRPEDVAGGSAVRSVNENLKEIKLKLKDLCQNLYTPAYI